jgi:uncharacterized protein involved in high-affinity Fe2+ transport
MIESAQTLIQRDFARLGAECGSKAGFIRHVDKESGVPDWWQPFSESWTLHYPSKEAD